MNAFILIHGGWHGGWSWNKITSRLIRAGHHVSAPDLPGHGADRTPASEVTLKSYTDCVCQIIDKQSEPVILVGHSMGGYIISQVAEYRPKKIRDLVYLASVIPRNGDRFALAPAEPIIYNNCEPAEGGVTWKLKSDVIKEALYEDCGKKDFERAESLLCNQPIRPIKTPLVLTKENFGSVSRVYIQCLKDKALSPTEQKMAYTEHPCRKVFTLDSSHSPFFSMPDELVNIFRSI